MTRIIARLNRPTHRLAARLRNARPGSVLILVVALLVLMALIGTAWISTTRTDRYAAVQHSFNTEIEMLVDGVVQMVQARMGDDLFQPAPPATPPQPPMYRPPPADPTL